MRVVYDPQHRHHQPRTELFYGQAEPHPDRPERVEAIRAALRPTPWERWVVGPVEYPLRLATSVHELAYVEHLRRRSEQMAAAGPDAEWFPYVWPRDPAMDTGTPIMGVTLDAAWRSACVALTAADLLLHGERTAFALCRPPGHHASPARMGGYCYFNNAALAAERLVSAGQRPGGVAVLDLDAHHGNGTQDVFYDSARVLYCSIHGHPSWGYPPHTGYAEDIGLGAGRGLTFNQPLDRGAGWPVYRRALDRALSRIAQFAPSFLVLSQGFDTMRGDRWGGLELRPAHFGRIGERLRSLDVPVAIVLEGGYEPPSLAAGTLALLEGLGADAD
jgi:acetoin utilization deacetylase AcuC-like enzyme